MSFILAILQPSFYAFRDPWEVHRTPLLCQLVSNHMAVHKIFCFVQAEKHMFLPCGLGIIGVPGGPCNNTIKVLLISQIKLAGPKLCKYCNYFSAATAREHCYQKGSTLHS